MRKIFFAILFILVVSCTQLNIHRTVTLEIPQHPWEKYTGAKLWYNLCWLDYGSLKTIYINQDTREVEINIPVGKTVYVCAYPLGEMRAFGCGITPLDKQPVYYLNQNEGYLADLLLNTEESASSRLNWQKLLQRALSQTTDFRYIDDEKLVKNVLNGTMAASAVNVNEGVEIEGLAVPGGSWISESVYDSRIIFSGTEMPKIKLPYGVNRYLNKERNLELRIVVDSEGNVFSYQRQSLVTGLI